MPCVAVRRGQVEAGNYQRPCGPAGAEDYLACLEPRRVVAFDRVGVGESCGAGLLVDVNPGPLQIVAQQRVLACVRGHVADAGEQPGVVERGFGARDPVERELPGLADQPRRLGKRAHRHGPVVRGHPPELIAGDQRRAGSKAGRAERRDDPGGSCADDHDVERSGRR